MSAFRKSESKPSSLVYPEENKQLANMLGHNCISIETAVIQLYCTESPYHSQWLYRDCGVLCFVKDNHRKTYFFRLYCLVRKRMVWEQEIYKNMEYTCPKIFLATFEADTCIFAFNFASELEAKFFNARVLERIAKESVKALSRQTSKKQEKTYKKKSRISKTQISKPIESHHTFHVGFKNMDVLKTTPSEVESFFEKKNINKKMLQTSQNTTPSAVTSIPVYRNKIQQNLLPRPKLTPSMFRTFHEGARQNTQSKLSAITEVHGKYQQKRPSLSKFHKVSVPNPPPNLQSKSPKGSPATPNLNTRRSLSPELPTIQNKGHLMSIEDSLAVLDEVSNLIEEMQRPKQVSLPVENLKSLEGKNTIEKILRRRNQLSQFSDSSFDSDNDDSWDN